MDTYSLDVNILDYTYEMYVDIVDTSMKDVNVFGTYKLDVNVRPVRINTGPVICVLSLCAIDWSVMKIRGNSLHIVSC